MRRGADTQPVMEAVDVGMRHRRVLHAAEGGQDVGVDLLPIDPLGRRPVARKVVAFKTAAEIRDGSRRAVLFLLANRIGAAVNCSLEPLGFLTRCSRAPVGKRADGVAALAPIELTVIVEDECPPVSGSDAGPKTLHRVVVGDLVSALRLRQLP